MAHMEDRDPLTRSGMRRYTPLVRGPKEPSGSSFVLSIVIFSLLSVPIMRMADGAPWQEWRGGPLHAAAEDGEGPEKGELKWAFQAGDQVLSSPVFYEGGMVEGSDDGWLYCLDPARGTLNWKFKAGGGIQSTTLLADGRAYFGSLDGNLYCISLPPPGSGEQPEVLWTYPCMDQVISSPHLCGEGSVITADLSGYVHRVASNGTGIWKQRMSEMEIWASPIVDLPSGAGYIGDVENTYVRFDLGTGENLTVKRFPAGSSFYSSGCISGGRLLLCSGETCDLLSLDPDTLDVVWSFDCGHPCFSTPTVREGMVYFTSYVYAWCVPFDDPDGDGNITMEEMLWSRELEDYQGGSSALAAGDRIYVGSDGWTFYCLDAMTGEDVWTFETRGYIYSSPSLYNRSVYFGSSDRTIYCLGDRPPGISVEVTVRMPEMTSDNVTEVMIRVMDREGAPVGAAEVSVVPSAGTIVGGSGGGLLSDENGELHLTFEPPDVSSRSTVEVTVTARRSGLEPGTAWTSIIVEPGEGSKEPPSKPAVDPWKKRAPYVVAIAAAITLNLVLFIALMLLRRRDSLGRRGVVRQ